MKKIIWLTIILAMVLFTSACYSTNSDGSKDVNAPLSKNTIYFETNGGTYIDSMRVYTLNDAPKTTKDDSVFIGWYLDKTLTTPVIFPLNVDDDMTIYAKWLKTSSSSTCVDCKIKWASNYSSSLLYDLSPNGFELDELSKLGYYMTITVAYDVYYKKDYDVWLDIGYAGSPKYEIALYDSDKTGTYENNLTTKTSSTHRTITLTCRTASLIGDKITLKVSTDNIQNIIYFKNISVTYQCTK